MSSSNTTAANHHPEKLVLTPERVFELLAKRYPHKTPPIKNTRKKIFESPKTSSVIPFPFETQKTSSILPFARKTDSNSISVLAEVFETRKKQRKLAKALQELKFDINENLVLSDLNDRVKSGEKIELETKNSRRNLLTFIPRISSSKFFKTWASRHDGLFGIIHHLASGLHRTTRECKSVLMLLTFLAEHFPRSFEFTANTFGLHPPIKRLNALETASLAKDIGLADKPLFDKLGRHLSVLNHGNHVLCPRADFESLTNDDAPKNHVFKGMLLKDNKKEEYTVCKVDVIEQMLKGMSRFLKQNVSNKAVTYNKFGRPMFDYPTSKNQTGVYYMDGVD